MDDVRLFVFLFVRLTLIYVSTSPVLVFILSWLGTRLLTVWLSRWSWSTQRASAVISTLTGSPTGESGETTPNDFQITLDWWRLYPDYSTLLGVATGIDLLAFLCHCRKRIMKSIFYHSLFSSLDRVQCWCERSDLQSCAGALQQHWCRPLPLGN